MGFCDTHTMGRSSEWTNSDRSVLPWSDDISYAPLKPSFALIGLNKEYNAIIEKSIKASNEWMSTWRILQVDDYGSVADVVDELFRPSTVSTISSPDMREAHDCPLHTIADDDLEKMSDSSDSVGLDEKGILARPWLEDEIGLPKVLVFLVQNEQVTRDITSLSRVFKEVKSIRNKMLDHRSHLIVGIIGRMGEDEVSDELLSTIRGSMEAEAISVISLEASASSIMTESLGKLLSVMESSIKRYYKIKQDEVLANHRQATANSSSLEKSCSTAFKLGVFAEACGDWEQSSNLYDEAYRYVHKINIQEENPFQSYLEIRTVAELIYWRVSQRYKYFVDKCVFLTLHLIADISSKFHHLQMVIANLHGNYDQSILVLEFERYIEAFRSPPFNNLPDVCIANHLHWLARQYERMAFLLSKFTTLHGTAIKFWQQAAECASRCSEKQTNEEIPKDSNLSQSLVTDGYYVGRHKLKLMPEGTHATRSSVSDHILMQHLKNIEVSINHNEFIIFCLQNARKIALVQNLSRTLVEVEFSLSAVMHKIDGQEQEALELLQSAAETLRTEKWEFLLVSALMEIQRLAAEINDQILSASVELELSTFKFHLKNGEDTQMATQGLKKLMGLTDSPREISVGINSNCWNNIVQVTSGVSLSSERRMFVVSLRNRLPIPLPIEDISLSAIEKSGFRGNENIELKATNFQMKLIDNGKNWMLWFPVPNDIVHSITASKLHIKLNQSLVLVYSLHSSNLEKQQIMPIARDSIRWGCLDINPKIFGNSSPEILFWGPPTIFPGEHYPFEVQIITKNAVCPIHSCFLEISSPNKSIQQRFSVPDLSKNETHFLSESLPPVFDVPGNEKQLNLDFMYRLQGSMQDSRISMVVSLPFGLPFQISVVASSFSGNKFLLPPSSLQQLGTKNSDSFSYSKDFLSDNSKGFVLPCSERLILNATILNMSTPSIPIMLAKAEYRNGEDSINQVSKSQDIIISSAGDQCSFPFILQPQETKGMYSLGLLAVHWNRTDTLTFVVLSSSHLRDCSRLSKDIKRKTKTIIASVQLPMAEFIQPLLAAKILDTFPLGTSLGFPFMVHLELSCGGNNGGEAKIMIDDPGSGIILSSLRKASIVLKPSQKVLIPLQMIPYHPGPLKLPKISLEFQDQNVALSMGYIAYATCGIKFHQ